MAMTEDTLVQQVTADYLLNELQWDASVMGMYERLNVRFSEANHRQYRQALVRFWPSKTWRFS